MNQRGRGGGDRAPGEGEVLQLAGEGVGHGWRGGGDVGGLGGLMAWTARRQISGRAADFLAPG